jgi:WD40 repeat protein
MLSWHPTQRVLAVGWSSGELITWNESSKTTQETKPLHATPLMVLEWSPSGELLVSGDYEGRIGIWKPNKGGRLTLLAGTACLCVS